MDVLTATGSAVGALADRVGPAVAGLGRGWGLGSGVVVAQDTVITTAHGLRGEEVTVTLSAPAGASDPGGSGSRRETGRVRGTDPDLDLAVVSVPTGDVEPVAWAPEAVEAAGPGTFVVALADPGGRGLRATPGWVSSARRPFRGPRGRRIPGGLEHTAPLPRGSSGGPLVDAEGRLLGLNALRLEGGLILAIPADTTLRERADALARGERAGRPHLGLALAPPRVARRLRRAVGLPERDGLLVRAVEEGSPADRAGVQRGDLVVAADGTPADSVEVLYAALDAAGPGHPLTLELVRGEEERAVEVTFA
jgi:serine protease Do